MAELLRERGTEQFVLSGKGTSLSIELLEMLAGGFQLAVEVEEIGLEALLVCLQLLKLCAECGMALFGKGLLLGSISFPASPAEVTAMLGELIHHGAEALGKLVAAVGD
jgi:hypothetical protein